MPPESRIVKRQIGVKVSKFLVVSGALPTGHVTRRMRNGHFRLYNAAGHYNGRKTRDINVDSSNLSHHTAIDLGKPE